MIEWYFPLLCRLFLMLRALVWLRSRIKRATDVWQEVHLPTLIDRTRTSSFHSINEKSRVSRLGNVRYSIWKERWWSFSCVSGHWNYAQSWTLLDWCKRCLWIWAKRSVCLHRAPLVSLHKWWINLVELPRVVYINRYREHISAREVLRVSFEWTSTKRLRASSGQNE